jgi:SAM-dependent methyltransferase
MAKQSNNILINYSHDRQFKVYVSKLISGSLVNNGCATKPCEVILDPHLIENAGLDHADTLHDKSNLDLLGTAFDIPEPDASLDCAFCIAVIEHLEEPERPLGECYRVLKPTGIAIYSAPFIYHLYKEPGYFFRYSKYGLVYFFEKVGLEMLELKALSVFWATFFSHGERIRVIKTAPYDTNPNLTNNEDFPMEQWLILDRNALLSKPKKVLSSS